MAASPRLKSVNSTFRTRGGRRRLWGTGDHFMPDSLAQGVGNFDELLKVGGLLDGVTAEEGASLGADVFKLKAAPLLAD